MASELEKGLEQAKQLTLYAGLPAPTDKIDEYLASGGKIIYFLTPEEKAAFRPLKEGESGVTWKSETSVKDFLFNNMGLWMGGQIGGHDASRAQNLASVVSDLIELFNFDQHSLKFLMTDQLPTRNALRNYRWVEDGIPLKSARGLMKGGAVVVVAAGPSLNSQWAELRRIRQNCPDTAFIVAGRTYARAMEEGVIPDLVVEVEQFEWDDRIFMFAPKPPPNTILCGPLTACPSLYQVWPGRIMILMDHNTAQLMKMSLHEESMDGGNSILHHMFNLATWVGANTICLAGVDLGYPVGATDTHADGTFPGFPKQILTAEHTRQEHLMMPGTDGSMVISSPAYRNFRLFLEMQIERARRANDKLKVYNFSPHGQKIDLTEYTEVAKWGMPSLPPVASSVSPSLEVPSSTLACTVISSSSGSTENASSTSASAP